MYASVRPTKSRSLLVLSALLAALLVPSVSSAKTVVYKDLDGVWHRIDSSEWPHPIDAYTRQIRGNVVTFNIEYRDQVTDNNRGFDAPGGVGLQRQQAVERAIQYIANTLNHTGSCDIQFQPSQTDGTGSLASAGPFFFTEPQFQSGTAQEHIKTGMDPSGQIPDIQATVDFGYTWHAGTGPAPQGQFDLEGVLLHELTHGLGMVSLSGSSGASVISGVYSNYENFLFTGNNKDLFVASPRAIFNGTASDLTGGDGGVFYTGPNAVAAFGGRVPVFAPSPYQNGSSISHWNTPSFTVEPKPVMIHAISAGETRRTYLPFEIGMLQDIGYTVVATGPTPTPGPTPTHSRGGSLAIALALLAVAGFTVSRVKVRSSSHLASDRG